MISSLARTKKGEGGSLTLVRNMILLLIVLFLLFYILKVHVIDTIEMKTDCEKERGVCSVVCGPSQSTLTQKCPKDVNGAAQVCCFDNEAILDTSVITKKPNASASTSPSTSTEKKP